MKQRLEVHSPTLKERGEMDHVHTDFDVRHGYRRDPDAHNAGLPYVDSPTARFAFWLSVGLVAFIAGMVWVHPWLPVVVSK